MVLHCHSTSHYQSNTKGVSRKGAKDAKKIFKSWLLTRVVLFFFARLAPLRENAPAIVVYLILITSTLSCSATSPPYTAQPPPVPFRTGKIPQKPVHGHDHPCHDEQAVKGRRPAVGEIMHEAEPQTGEGDAGPDERKAGPRPSHKWSGRRQQWSAGQPARSAPVPDASAPCLPAKDRGWCCSRRRNRRAAQAWSLLSFARCCTAPGRGSSRGTAGSPRSPRRAYAVPAPSSASVARSDTRGGRRPASAVPAALRDQYAHAMPSGCDRSSTSARATKPSPHLRNARSVRPCARSFR